MSADIRNGLQYECIGCGACADACNAVMDKVGYAGGLVKYSSEKAMKNRWGRAKTLRHVLRRRVLICSGILMAIVTAMAVSLALRTPFKVDVVRDRATLARMVQSGQIESIYRLQIMNATESGQRFRIGVAGLPGLAVVSDSDICVDAMQSCWVAVRVQAPYEAAAAGSHAIHFEIRDQYSSAAKVLEKSVFLVPR